jgi:hypothetical protein
MKSAERSLILIVPQNEELTDMSDKMTPKEPEHVSCDICMKEIPIDEANSFEAVDYVIHFCGLECFDKWKEKKQSQQEGDD